MGLGDSFVPRDHANGTHQPFVLGDWQVDPQRLSLERDGERVQLQPRAMDLLVYLVERRADVVSSAELIDHVWSPSVVGDENVKVAVSKLRAALGDDSRSPSYIETVPRRGYRIVARVDQLPVGPFSPQRAFKSAGGGRGLPLATLGVLLAVCAALVWWSTAEQAGAPRRMSIALAPFESVASDSRAVRLSALLEDELSAQISALGPLVLKDPASADFLVEGTLHPLDGAFKLAVRLIRVNARSVVLPASISVSPDAGETTLKARTEYLAMMLVVAGGLVLSTDNSTSNPLAQARYVRGVLEFLEGTQGKGADLGASVRHLEAAARLDPKFVEPRRQLGIHYKHRMVNTLRYDEAVGPAHRYASEVLALDPDQTFLLGTINSNLDLDYDAAIANFEHARGRQHPDGEIESEIALALLAKGDLEEALERFHTAVRMSAGFNRTIVHNYMSMALLALGRYEEACTEARKAINSRPERSWGFGDMLSVSRACYYAGERDVALDALEKAISVHHNGTPEMLAGVLGLFGRTGELQPILDSAEDRYQRGEIKVFSALFWGEYYVGNLDAAFVWLGRAINNREFWLLPFVKRWEELDEIRGDKRFKAAMARLAEIEAEGTRTKSVAYP